MLLLIMMCIEGESITGVALNCHIVVTMIIVNYNRSVETIKPISENNN
jgi:hypothetical protein